MRRSAIAIFVCVLCYFSPVNGAPTTSRPTTNRVVQRPKPAETHEGRAKERLKRGYAYIPADDPGAKGYLQVFRKMDQQVETYLRKHEVSEKIEKGLWAGVPTLGMTEEELKLFGGLTVSKETEDATTYVFEGWDEKLKNRDIPRHPYRVTMKEGRVVEVEHPE